MKKFAALIVVFVLLIFSGCADAGTGAQATLKITSTDWSGWTADYKPQVTEKEYSVKKGDKISLGGRMELTVTIRNVSADSITIKTNEPMSEGKEGIDLYTNATTFVVRAGKKLALITPTTDAGDIYYFEIAA